MSARTDANKRLMTQLEAVANETRLELLELLLAAGEPLTVGELVAQVNSVEQPAVSKGLNQLTAAGLLSRQRKGRHIYYSIVQPEFKRVAGYLQRFSVERRPARTEGGAQGTRYSRAAHKQISGGTMSVISLGAGVQSTALMLMALHGELGDMPRHAIFADTGWEPQAVYEHLRWLRSLVTERFGEAIQMHQVSRSNIKEDAIAFVNGEKSRWPNAPLFVRGENGSRGILRRQCTSDYKVVPIQRKMRDLLKDAGQRHVEMWLGISLDEVTRMKDSQVAWVTNRYPLIERRMTREDCLRWLYDHGYPEPPKSACVGCPFHSNPMWSELRDGDPAAWRDAVEFDRSIRQLPGVRGQLFLHPARVPLDQVDLGALQEKRPMTLSGNHPEVGTMSGAKLSGHSGIVVEGSFGDECDGLCGV